jgi:hypothetical protein
MNLKLARYHRHRLLRRHYLVSLSRQPQPPLQDLSMAILHLCLDTRTPCLLLAPCFPATAKQQPRFLTRQEYPPQDFTLRMS